MLNSIRSLIVALVCIFPIFPTYAGEFHVSMIPPDGWALEKEDSSSTRKFATISYAPPAGRDAWLTIKEVGEIGDKVNGNRNLDAIHIWWLTQFGRPEKETRELWRFSTPHGSYIASIFEDPKLKGKPVVLGDYKYVLHITGVVGRRYVVSGVLLSQNSSGLDFEDTKSALMEIKLK